MRFFGFYVDFFTLDAYNALLSYKRADIGRVGFFIAFLFFRLLAFLQPYFCGFSSGALF
jgi:hypothetical protein